MEYDLEFANTSVQKTSSSIQPGVDNYTEASSTEPGGRNTTVVPGKVHSSVKAYV